MLTNWTSKKQQTVALSSSEAEYQALSECVQEAMFTKNLVHELTGRDEMAIIYEDNLGAIFLVKNSQVSSRTKHIDVRHHCMRELQTNKKIDVRFKRSENNSSDIMTKNTTRDIHEKHSKNIKNGTLDFWKEDVKQDDTVTEFGSSQVNFIDAFLDNDQTLSSSIYLEESASNSTSDPATRSRNLSSRKSSKKKARRYSA